MGFSGEAKAGTEHNVSGWAWSGTIGWIAMNCTDLGDCTNNFGVNIRTALGAPTVGDISGYGWSETMGWVCFGMTCAGTTPEGGPSYLQYRQSFEGQQDQIYGWAQVMVLGDDGWISFNCNKDVDSFDTCGSAAYHTVLNLNTGDLTNGLLIDHWGWSATDEGLGVGWVDTSDIFTTWVPADIGKILRPEGIYEPDTPDLPGTHLHTFDVTVANFFGIADQYLDCSFVLPDGSTRTVSTVLTDTVRDGQVPLPYTVQSTDAIMQNQLWYTIGCRVADLPFATACAVDSDCAPDELCDPGLGRCRYVMDVFMKKLPIFTHGNDWTGLNSNEDQYQSLKCFAAFPDNFFRNAAKCDFTGDSSFSLTMRRGMPLEGNCSDGIDNDQNGQIDCADRYCQGLSYRCNRLARTSCTFGQVGDGLVDCSDPSYVTGELCCTQQPIAPGSSFTHIVDGMECEQGQAKDGYFDCSCDSFSYGIGDCYAPGPQIGDLCCDENEDVIQFSP